ncbi:uncharacterized protein LOC124442455 isoform X2 [Xenia sp. Carnegie-2017]|uniref:uncharacterized protein LOC124442455 isoform X2 n=1 Tax=Xenia sp. Carnegie-2017 TaxID=2897299 RepID=UPI001F03FB6A|nr:uncharacterized protein LOC124442455 isoform X2 [Xenia sp. Carnegie-2017]
MKDDYHRGCCILSGNICHPFKDRLCKDGTLKPYRCIGNKQIPLTCDDQSTSPMPTSTCKKLMIPFALIRFTHHVINGNVPFKTKATIFCHGKEGKRMTITCEKNGWNEKISSSICSCTVSKLQNYKIEFSQQVISGHCPFNTEASVHCHDGTVKNATCIDSDLWNPEIDCSETTDKPLTKKILENPTNPSNQVLKSSKKVKEHHTDEHTIIIFSVTIGAILSALILLVVVVSCQRRTLRLRITRARLRHQQDQDAFTAFITYHRDIRLMLPSYDEAMTQSDEAQPPTFEEALGDDELPSAHVDTASSTIHIMHNVRQASNPTTSEFRSNPESQSSPIASECVSDTASVDQQSTLPTNENTFFRSLRALFGGRAFRPDAIYCRFVPEEEDNGSTETSPQTRDGRPQNISAEDELTNMFTHADLN